MLTVFKLTLPDRLTFVKLFKSDNVTKLSSLPPVN
nr:MAG TPA: hypothetical protein [Bacteriophage sp.]